jgi:hypothetical protein
MKVPAHIGNPDAAVVAIVDPSSVRVQFVIEYVERYTTSRTVVIIFLFVIVFIVSLGVNVVPGSTA